MERVEQYAGISISADSQDRLEIQIAACPLKRACSELQVQVAVEFLKEYGISDLLEISIDIVKKFPEYIKEKMKAGYRGLRRCPNLPGQWRKAYRTQAFRELLEEASDCPCESKTYQRRALDFLMDQGVYHLKEITYSLRYIYESFLHKEINSKYVSGYLRDFDRLKLHAIKKAERGPQERTEKLRADEDGIVFLPYAVRSYSLSMELRNLLMRSNGDALLWDFREMANSQLKEQMLTVLNAFLKIKMDNHIRMRAYLKPLKEFFLFCKENGIQDILRSEEEQVLAFLDQINYLSDKAYYRQIVWKISEILFVSGGKINWYANLWFFSRLQFPGERLNPSARIETFRFWEIKNLRNREALKRYLETYLGLTKYTVRYIIQTGYILKEYLHYLDQRQLTYDGVTLLDIKGYFEVLDNQEKKEDTFNRKVLAIFRFYTFFQQEGFIRIAPFRPELFLKKQTPIHHDRSLPADTLKEIWNHIHLFPEHLRLMFLHLYCLGLRINEVCTLRGKNYLHKENVSYLHVYQNKMKAEKNIPIPDVLYQAMEIYKKRHGIGPNDYVFQDSKGRVYSAGNFWHQMVCYCRKYQITCRDYVFRCHDYRHNIATRLFDQGIDIQTIREFLGHKFDDMTKQYIDYIPKKIRQKSEKYYREEESLENGRKYGKGAKSQDVSERPEKMVL